MMESLKYTFVVNDDYDKVLNACISAAKATGQAQWGNSEKTVIKGHNGMNLLLVMNPTDWSISLYKHTDGNITITIGAEGFDNTCCQYIIDRFLTAFASQSLSFSTDFIQKAGEASKRKVKLIIRPMIFLFCILILALLLFGSFELIFTVGLICVFVFAIVYACAAAAAGAKMTKKTTKDASVVKRAAVGGIIAGPTGAIVGALSAVDKNNKNRK